jgi:hypothetical protein
MIFDWKTGKSRGYNTLQLAMNAMCAAPCFRWMATRGLGEFDVYFIYVDDGTSEGHHVTMDIINPKSASAEDIETRQMGDIVAQLEVMELAHESGDFPATKNDKCKWCDWKGCGL